MASVTTTTTTMLCLVLCLFFFLSTTLAAPSLNKYPKVQYDVNFLQAGFNFDDKRLLTFAPFDDVAGFFAHQDVQDLFLKNVCTFFDRHTHTTIPPTTTLFDAIIHHDPEIHCGAAGDVIKMESIRDWKLDLTDDAVKKIRKEALLEYVAALRRQQLGESVTPTREYPWYKHDIMSASVDTLTGWAIAFLEHHWGDLHPFPVYPNQLRDALEKTTCPLLQAELKKKYMAFGDDMDDYGIYHLDTGKKLTPLQSQHLAKARQVGQYQRSAAPATTINFGVTGDWGAGTKESQLVADLLAKNAHYTLNLGDLYPVGSPEDARKHALGKRLETDIFEKAVSWRTGSLGSLWQTGNHEMYSRGYGLFDDVWPTVGMKDNTTKTSLGQKTSYSVLENEHWRLLFLDTGYTTYSPLIHNDTNPQMEMVIDWLKNIVKIDNPADTRGVILFTHHNFVSAFKDSYPATAAQLKALLGDKTILHFFGHEHKAAIYEKTNLSTFTSYPRCVGTGGFNVDQAPVPPTARTSGLIAYDNREYDVIPGDFWNSTCGYNGYTMFNLTGDQMSVYYYTIQWADKSKNELNMRDGHLTMAETFSINPKTGDVEQRQFNVVDKDITIVQNVERIVPKATTELQTLHQMAGYGFDMEKYYAANEKVRYTRRINPTPKYSEEAQKEELLPFIQQHVLPLLQRAPRAAPQIDYDVIVDQDGHEFFGMKH